MQVKELIEKLKQFDGELLVVVSGYEMGYDDIDDPELREIQSDNMKNGKKESRYFGKYSSYCEDGEHEKIDALFIK